MSLPPERPMRPPRQSRLATREELGIEEDTRGVKIGPFDGESEWRFRATQFHGEPMRRSHVGCAVKAAVSVVVVAVAALLALAAIAGCWGSTCS